MAVGGLSDSLTIAILLVLVFGAVAFYLYSRLSQNEKRVGLLENLLLTLKVNTEASLNGPDSVQTVMASGHIDAEEIESVAEENYADMLKEIPTSTEVVEEGTELASALPSSESLPEEEELSRTVASVDVPASVTRTMDVNYESMSVKELQALAKQRGITGIPARKRELIDALKRSGAPAPTPSSPLAAGEGELEGGVVGERGFQIDLQNS